MLDDALKERLREVFSELSAHLTLVLANSTHEKQRELLELSLELASTSSKLELRVEGPEVAELSLAIHKDERPPGVVFRGVPGGHELTSLVLALLHADGRGKLPDAAVRERVAALRGPVSLRTYVSLSCQNCPDVVQALNLMALWNPELSHEMVDGELYPAEVDALGLQGVPAVVMGDEVLHVGRASFVELLTLLERKLGRSAIASPERVRDYDVVVLGGGPAGISAAVYSARKGLRTAIVAEKVGGQVSETLGIENLIGTPYTEGARLVADLEKHAASYPIDLLSHRRVERVTRGARIELAIEGGERLTASSLIVATGARWRELGIPGERENIGRGVAFCPHCDGPFYKGRPVAVVGGGNSGVEAAIDLAGIASHVTLIEYADALKADAVLVAALRKKPNVEVIVGARTREILASGGKVSGLSLVDRATEVERTLAVEGVFVQIGLSPNSALVADLVERTRTGEIVIDDRGRTSAPGIYAAGDVTTVPFKQIVVAIGEGAKAALAVFEDGLRRAAA